LRREVRVTGVILLVLLPLSWMVSTFPWGRAVASSRAIVTNRQRPALPVGECPPIVSLRIEPVALALPSVVPAHPQEIQGPVALPGYIIPDDGSEETAHAGS
jgi:hypothetical protein